MFHLSIAFPLNYFLLYGWIEWYISSFNQRQLPAPNQFLLNVPCLIFYTIFHSFALINCRFRFHSDLKRIRLLGSPAIEHEPIFSVSFFLFFSLNFFIQQCFERTFRQFNQTSHSKRPISNTCDFNYVFSVLISKVQ